MADGTGVSVGVLDGVGVGVRVGVRLGKMGVLLGVSVGRIGELSAKFKRGSIVAVGPGGVNVGGTAMANDSSCICGSEIGAASVGKGDCSTQAAWVSSKIKQHKNSSLPDFVMSMAAIIPPPFGLCQH